MSRYYYYVSILSTPKSDFVSNINEYHDIEFPTKLYLLRLNNKCIVHDFEFFSHKIQKINKIRLLQKTKNE